MVFADSVEFLKKLAEILTPKSIFAMSCDWLQEWSEKKIQLAFCLSAGECGGTYAEAVMILCGVLSGIAADIWPGTNKDKKRFVELLVKHTDPARHVTRVSVPLLVGEIRESGDIRLANKLKTDLLPVSDTRVITGEDVDKSILELIHAYPSIGAGRLRRHTYACLLYEELRSGYAHEYRPGARSDSWAMGAIRQKSAISYINMLDRPDRLIYFSIIWLADMVRDVVSDLAKSNPFPSFPNYPSWWLDD